MADTDADYDIVFSNICCTVNLGCRLNLQKLAENMYNVEHQKGKITIRLRKPKVVAHVWGKGSILCVGARTEENARMGVRRVARMIQKLGFAVRLPQIRVVNVTASCTLPFRVQIAKFAVRFREASYEPELYPAANYKIPTLKASLRIFSSGSISVVAPNVANVYKAVEYVYPRLEEFRLNLTAADEVARAGKRMLQQRQLLFQ